jgi:hypothetical protein
MAKKVAVTKKVKAKRHLGYYILKIKSPDGKAFGKTDLNTESWCDLYFINLENLLMKNKDTLTLDSAETILDKYNQIYTKYKAFSTYVDSWDNKWHGKLGMVSEKKRLEYLKDKISKILNND